MEKEKMGSAIVGITAWGMLLGIIILTLAGKIQESRTMWFFFGFLCVVGFFAAVQNMSKR